MAKHSVRTARPLRLAAVSAVALAAAVPLADRAAGSGTGKPTVCEWYDEGTVAPAVSMKPQKNFTYSTGGETGKITCNGPILGQKPSGPGTVGFEARIGLSKAVTCASGGSGDYAGFFTFPTADGGEIHGVEYGRFEFGLKNKVFGGTFRGTLFSGSFVTGLVEGDCEAGVTKMSFHTKDAKAGKGSRKVTFPAAR